MTQSKETNIDTVSHLLEEFNGIDPKLIGNKLDGATLKIIMSSLNPGDDDSYFKDQFDTEKSLI